MKKLIRAFLLPLIVFFGVTFNQLVAQTASTYVYSYTTPNYTAITGTSLVSGSGSWDAGLVFTNVPIGFTFYFEGQPYSSVGVNSNGFIWFGTGTTSTTEYNPISDASLGTNVTGVVSAYGTQLEAFATANLSAAPTGAPEISYTTTGSACSQAFTVQWKGAFAASDPGSQSGFLGDLERIDLQIVLDQTTNTIGILIHANPYPFTGSSSAEVGIRGINNTDFTSLTCWTAGCSQTANNAATGTLDPRYPATKSEFIFTPPPCAFSVNSSGTNASCGNNGTITITTTGGTGPFTYIINNAGVVDSNQTGMFSGLGQGTYCIAVTNGTCTETTSETLTSNVTIPTASYTQPACIGGSMTLSTTAVNGATYSWTGPNGFTSSQQNPIIANLVAADSGTYTIVDTVGGCASGPGTTGVVIGGATAPRVSSNSPLCSGATLNLVDSTSGGTYSWTGPNSFTSTSQNPSITNTVAADSGTYSVVQTVSGCASPAATLHVAISSALPAPKVSSNSPLCSGTTLTLIDSTAGATYNWTGPNSFISSLQNPTVPNVVIADSGTYTVVNTVSGCASLPAMLHIAISSALPAPKIGSNSPLCAGATLTLTDSTAGATYGWTGPNSFTSNLQTPAISNVVVSDSGTYTVVDTISGCASSPATLHVVINTMPAAPKVGSNNPLCVGATLMLTDSTAGATYNWTGPNSFTSSLQNPTVPNIVIADSGIYTVVNTVGTCNSAPATTHVAVNPIPSTPFTTSTGPYCTGDTIRLSASTIVNATYNWTGPNTFTDQQNPIKPNATKSDSGTYSVIATVNGCNSLPATVNVVVNTTPPAPTATSGSFCVGTTMQLNASTVTNATYNWTGPNDFTDQQNPTKANVTLSDSGVYTVIATVGSCSSAPATTDVIVALPPSAPQLSYNNPVCEGSTLDLMAANINGATFNWTGPNNFNNQQNPTKPNASYTDSGTYTAIATIGTCSSPPASIDVAISFTPTLSNINYNNPVCSGDTLKLMAQSANGVTYNWTGSGNFSSNQQNVILANTAITDSGLYIVSATLGNCTSIPDSFHIIVNVSPASPTLSASSDTICSSDSSHLCVLTTFNNYQWNTVIQGNAGDTTQCIYVYNSGGYYVTVTDNNGCTATSTPHLQINAYPATSVSIVVQGDTLTSFGASAYQWIFNDTDITGATGNVYIAQHTGNYSVQIVDANGCTSTSSSTPVTVATTVGLNEIISLQDLEIYPNPASAILNVRYTGPLGKNCTLTLFDILGNKIMQQPLNFNSAGTRSLDVSYLPRGMYLLQLQTGDQSITQKIAIQ